MKIGVIGDNHFGSGYNMGRLDPKTQINSRLLDFENTFNSIIDSFVKRNVKAVVLTGDIFETRHPTSVQLNIFSKCVQRTIDFGMEVIINVGNHDQQRHTSTTTVDIFNKLKLPKLKVYSEIDLHTLNDNTHLILMPYRDRKMMGADTNSNAILKIETEINQISKDLKGTKIIVGHFMLEKSPEDSDPDTFSINELILPLSMFDNYDVVIMGHIHKHQVVSNKKPIIIYSGSMDKVSFGERGHQKISIIIDTDDIENFEIIKTKVRNLFVLELDYTDENLIKDEINNKIMEDINYIDQEHSLKNSISKVIIKVNENNLYYINQPEIKNFIVDKKVKFCTGIHINSTNNRQLRNSAINETLSKKKAIVSFINGLIEQDNIKRKLLVCAEKIMEEVDSK